MTINDKISGLEYSRSPAIKWLLEAERERIMQVKVTAKAKERRTKLKATRSNAHKRSTTYKEDVEAFTQFRIFDIEGRQPAQGERDETCSWQTCTRKAQLGCYLCLQSFCLDCAKTYGMIPTRRYPINTKVIGRSRIRVGEFWCRACDERHGVPKVFYTIGEWRRQNPRRNNSQNTQSTASSSASSSAATSSAATSSAGASSGSSSNPLPSSAPPAT